MKTVIWLNIPMMQISHQMKNQIADDARQLNFLKMRQE